MKILIINPGSTSTKIALYENGSFLMQENITHNKEDLAPFSRVLEQFEYRKKLIERILKEKGISIEKLDAVVGRGGMIPHLHAGGYAVTKELLDTICSENIIQHASNLGAPLAKAIADRANLPSFIYDSVSSDEMDPKAKYTGIPEVMRESFSHVLNSKAVCRKVAQDLKTHYENENFIVAHLGGGISITAHQKGRIVDLEADDEGSFAPERAGRISTHQLINLIFEKKYTLKQIMDRTRGVAGIRALLGTNDMREVSQKVEEGNQDAKIIFDAMVYNIAKGIGAMSASLKMDISGIILTGGMAYNESITTEISTYVNKIAPVYIIAGEHEMKALALGAERLLNGQEEVFYYST